MGHPAVGGGGDLLAVRVNDRAVVGGGVRYVQGTFVIAAQGDLLSVGDDVTTGGDAGDGDDRPDAPDGQSHQWADDEQNDRHDQFSDVVLAGALLPVRRHGLILGLVRRLVRGADSGELTSDRLLGGA